MAPSFRKKKERPVSGGRGENTSHRVRNNGGLGACGKRFLVLFLALCLLSLVMLQRLAQPTSHRNKAATKTASRQDVPQSRSLEGRSRSADQKGPVDPFIQLVARTFGDVDATRVRVRYSPIEDVVKTKPGREKVQGLTKDKDRIKYFYLKVVPASSVDSTQTGSDAGTLEQFRSSDFQHSCVSSSSDSPRTS